MSTSYRYKEGRSEYNKKYRMRKKEELGDYYTEYNLRFRSKNPAPYLLQSAKHRAKKKGLDFDLSPEDLTIPEVCPVLGIPIFLQAGRGKSPNSPSLDRIDNLKGYVKGNVQVISWRANDLKADGTLEEFVKLVEFMRG